MSIVVVVPGCMTITGTMNWEVLDRETDSWTFWRQSPEEEIPRALDRAASQTCEDTVGEEGMLAFRKASPANRATMTTTSTAKVTGARDRAGLFDLPNEGLGLKRVRSLRASPFLLNPGGRPRALEKLQDSSTAHSIDQGLLDDFDRMVGSDVPHEEEGRIVRASPLADLTQAVREAAREEYGLDLGGDDLVVFGKFEGELPGGSVKMRPAVAIIRDAIASGRLRRGQTVFEATSGNFGIALGQLAKLGLRVVVLVSRKLQEGVLEELERSGVKSVNLDVDICPAPGIQMDPNLLVAKVVAGNMRERLQEVGLDAKPFDSARAAVEELLGRQDVITLAKVLAEAYGGFCPAQYENELNPAAHETVTGPEIAQQLKELGRSMADFNIVCAFGTGGTSTGLSRFVQKGFGKKTVHVVFPREGQDVAGIRTRSKAAGLAFYQPELLAGQHDVDFEQARKLLVDLAGRRNLDLGESSGLALYAVIQMVNFGVPGKFVVILADGIEKYRQMLKPPEKDETEGKLEVTVQQAREHLDKYAAVVWTHPGYAPNEEGSRLVVASLGSGSETPPLEIIPAMDVARAVMTKQLSPALTQKVDKRPKTVLLVCMSGNTSLRVAQLLVEKGIKGQSLIGGITNLARENGKPLQALIRPAS
jgi:cysteine synthase A